MPPKNKLTGTNNPNSARYQFNYELSDTNGPRVNDARIPGGGRTKTGGKMGITSSTMPPPAQIKMGGKMVVTRGMAYDTDEAIKPLSQPELEGGGIFNDIGNLIDSTFGTGKKKAKRTMGGARMPEAGQRQPIKLPDPPKEENEITKRAIMSGQGKKRVGKGIFGDIGTVVDDVGDVAEIAGMGKKVGGGLFGQIGSVLDGVSDIIGLGKKSVKGPDGNIMVAGKMTKKKKGDMRKAVKQIQKEFGAGTKILLEQLK